MKQSHRLTFPLPASGFHLFPAGLLLAVLASVTMAAGPVIPAQKPVDHLSSVPLFEAMAGQQLDVKLVHKNEFAGNLFIKNMTDKPINVKMPDSFVGVHVLNQGFFGTGNGNSGFGNSGFGNQSGQGAGQGQGAQTTGGGGAGNSPLSSPVFSVPPGSVVRLPVNTVCLEHGRATPSSRMEYRIFPVSRFSRDPALPQLLAHVASGKVPQKAAQAAAWHLASGKSWKDLSEMKFRRVGSLPDTPHFRRNDLTLAQKLVEKSQAMAARSENAQADLVAADVTPDRRKAR